MLAGIYRKITQMVLTETSHLKEKIMARPRKVTHSKEIKTPETSYEAMKEVRKLEEQLDRKEETVSKLSLDDMNKAPIQETEGQTKISQKEARNSNDVYLKPVKSIYTMEAPAKWQEATRARAWERVKVVAENKSLKGDAIELWTKRFKGDNADFWIVPVNVPIWIPRLLARQIEEDCKYHEIKMMPDDNMVPKTDTYAIMQDVKVEATTKRFSCKEVGGGFDFKAVSA